MTGRHPDRTSRCRAFAGYTSTGQEALETTYWDTVPPGVNAWAHIAGKRFSKTTNPKLTSPRSRISRPAGSRFSLVHISADTSCWHASILEATERLSDTCCRDRCSATLPHLFEAAADAAADDQ